MKRLSVAEAFSLALFAIAATSAGASMAQPVDPKVHVEFKQIVPACTSDGCSVSQSRPASGKDPSLKASVTYKFLISNNTTNALNRVFFSSTWENVGVASPIEFDSFYSDSDTPYLSTSPDTHCDKGTDAASGKTTLICSVATSIAPGDPPVSMYVIARAPSSGNQIKVVWSGGGFEGNGGDNGCCATPGQVSTTLTEQQSGSTYTSFVQSFVKTDGAQLFTGDRFITQPEDLGTTSVNTPKLGSYALSQLGSYFGFISEKSISPVLGTNEEKECKANGRFKTCFATEITIPKANVRPSPTGEPFNKQFDTADLLKILLRVDSSAIKGGTKIEDVTPAYFEEAGGTVVKKSVLQCKYVDVVVDGSTVRKVSADYAVDGTTSDLPCWLNRREIRRNVDLDWTPLLDKDFEWTIYHDKNGRYVIN